MIIDSPESAIKKLYRIQSVFISNSVGKYDDENFKYIVHGIDDVIKFIEGGKQ
jgi:hypothetical protein